MQALSHRLLTFLSLALLAGAFTWVMYDPVLLRLISASIFGLFDIFVFYKAIEAGRQS